MMNVKHIVSVLTNNVSGAYTFSSVARNDIEVPHAKSGKQIRGVAG